MSLRFCLLLRLALTWPGRARWRSQRQKYRWLQGIAARSTETMGHRCGVGPGCGGREGHKSTSKISGEQEPGQTRGTQAQTLCPTWLHRMGSQSAYHMALGLQPGTLDSGRSLFTSCLPHLKAGQSGTVDFLSQPMALVGLMVLATWDYYKQGRDAGF